MAAGFYSIGAEGGNITTSVYFGSVRGDSVYSFDSTGASGGGVATSTGLIGAVGGSMPTFYTVERNFAAVYDGCASFS
jgi:hypothetical protein